MAITDKTTLNLTLRPRNFDEIIGLQRAVSVIKQKVDRGEIPRAILIRGPYGTGKTTLSHIIARYIQGPFFEGEPDINEVNGAHARKIENMRALADSAGSYPMVGTYKVIILDECHKLTGDAQDVLLKELEVPKSPTVWILCTTDPQDLNKGVVARCFPLDTDGMDLAARHELVTRAAKQSGYNGGDEKLAAFEIALTKNQLVSPRQILQAFEQLMCGIPPEEAVSSQMLVVTPEYQAIAMCVVYGSWDKPTELWGGKMHLKPLGELLREFDDTMKKRSKKEDSEDSMGVDDSDILDNKPQAATAIRAIVAAFLKGFVLPKVNKNGTYRYPKQDECQRAYDAMFVLANAIPGSAFELQWQGLFTTLWRVNMKMQQGGK